MLQYMARLTKSQTLWNNILKPPPQPFSVLKLISCNSTHFPMGQRNIWTVLKPKLQWKTAFLGNTRSIELNTIIDGVLWILVSLTGHVVHLRVAYILD